MMIALLTAASLAMPPPQVVPETPRETIPVICLALAPKLVDSVAEGLITRKQAAGIFTECLKEFKGQGAQF
jgi:hypothetical protein